MNSKTEARKELKKSLSLLSVADKSSASTRLCEKLLQDPRIAKANTLGIFLPLPDEPDLRPALTLLHQKGCRLALPFPSTVSHWDFHWIQDVKGSLDGPWGLELPEQGPKTKTQALEIILVPGRGFTPLGQRIGRGKGIYDRLLNNTNSITIGIGFACQLRDSLPSEPHDVLLSEVWVA